MLIDSSQIKDVKIPGMNDGTGKAVCNGQEEILNAGTCHICKKVLNIVFPIQDQRIWYCLHLLWNDEK